MIYVALMISINGVNVHMHIYFISIRSESLKQSIFLPTECRIESYVCVCVCVHE